MSAERPAPPRLFGLAAEFDSPEAVLAAARALTALGYARVEAYTPMPVDELAEALGSRRTFVAPVVLAAACVGSTSGFAMQWFAHVVHYPMNVGGKPLNSWPMFFPITFEMAILCAAVSGVAAMLFMNRLPRLAHPMFRLNAFARASRDRFFLCVEARDPLFDLPRTRAALESMTPLSVQEVPQ